MAKKIAANKKKPVEKKMNETISFLIENVMEKSEVVLAIKNIRDKLTNMAEDIASIQPKDVMPLMDSMTEAFGPQAADAFNKMTTDLFQQTLTAIQTAKTALDKEITRFEAGVEGNDISDAGMDMEAEPAGEELPMDAPPEAPVAPAPQSGGLSEIPPDAAGNAEDDSLGGGFAGRPAKEGALRRGRVISEDVMSEDYLDMPVVSSRPKAPAPAIDQHPHKSASFDANLHNLGVFHGQAGTMARNIEAMINSEPLDGSERKSLANVLSHFAAFGNDPSHWSDAEAKLEMSLQSSGIWDASKPAVKKIVAKLRQLAHFLQMHHEGLIESAIKMLKNSADPDALVLNTFRIKLSERRDAQTAAIQTARKFAINVDDVVSVVREAARLKCRCKTGKAGSKNVKIGEGQKKCQRQKPRLVPTI